MYSFDYHQATSLDDAAQKLAADDEASLLAGGQTLIPTLKQRLAMPTTLVDISRIDALNFIRLEGDVLVIGAATCHATVATSQTCRDALPALASLANHIGDPAVRHRGTLGGSIANNDPSADYPAAALALGATIVTTQREIPADDFFTGLFETALEPGEILKEVRFPLPVRAAYSKFPNPASRYAMVGVFIAQTSAGPKVGVTGAGQEGVFRWRELEDALAQNWSTDALKGLSLAGDTMIADLHGDGDYRAHLVTVMAKRTLEAMG
ncbi:MAG: xanthine dehydrogenase family protein subunit M [Parvibaculaceae bacterium]|nr:xanthine dehydrogenase family protein subunit M [Parvibaculaceae bacterium]